MPRVADARLEGRILDAAYQIWSERGEDALTMRAVALAARTTTPTLYERFSHKSDLLALLRRRSRLNLFAAMQPSRSPVEACRRALDFFTAHPHDFRLISEDWAIAFASREPMPSFEFIKRRLAAQLGGAPDRHTSLALSLVALLHGTATLLHSSNVHKKIFRDFRHACISACAALIHADARKLPRSKRSSPPGPRPSITDRNLPRPGPPFRARMKTTSARPQAPAIHPVRRSSPDPDATLLSCRS